MAGQIITTSGGTTVRLESRDGETLVVLDNPNAPDDMHDHVAGRLVPGGFQPASFAIWAGTPEALRAIADLIEGGE